MNRYIAALLLIGIVLMPQALFAQSKDAAKDEYIYQRLLGERADIYEQYVAALKKGKNQLKENGDIDLKIKHEILTLRSKKDRVETRILTIALRHGWDVPPLSEPDMGKSLDVEARELEKVFGIANVLVKSELRKDVGQFTSSVSLPVQSTIAD